MKERFKPFYMQIARETAELSRAKRLKVGAIIVKNNNVIAFGFNGTPTGWDNNCEKVKPRLFYGRPSGPQYKTELETVPEIIHAEMNSIYKLAKSHESGDGAAMFITHSPCLECAKGIFMSGIKEVYYGDEYRSKEGVDFLLKSRILVEQL